LPQILDRPDDPLKICKKPKIPPQNGGNFQKQKDPLPRNKNLWTENAVLECELS
jgi:hypothetical protein